MSTSNSSEESQSESERGSEGGSSENSSNSSYYTCLVCMRMARVPRISFCGHVFCHSCIGHWIKSQGVNAKCPYCQSLIGRNTLISVHQIGEKSHKRSCKPIGKHRQYENHVTVGLNVPSTSMFMGGCVERPPELMPRIKPLPKPLLRNVPTGPIRLCYLEAPLWQRMSMLVILYFMFIVYVLSFENSNILN